MNLRLQAIASLKGNYVSNYKKMKKNMETKNHFMNDMTVLTNDLFIKGCKNE